MLGKTAQFKQLVLFAADFIILYASLFLTLLIRYQEKLTYEKWGEHFLPFTVIYLIWVIIFYINGLYDISIARNTASFRRTFIQSLLINVLLAVLIFYLNPFFGIAPKTNLFLNLLVFSVLFFCWRGIYNRFISSSILKNRVLLIGEDLELREVVETIREKPQLGYKIVSVINTDENKTNDMKGVVPHYNIRELEHILKEKKIDTIVVPANLGELKDLTARLYPYLFNKIDFVDFISFYEILTNKIPISAVNKYWFLENLKEREKNLYDSLKIILDYTLAVFIGIISLAILPFTILAIKLDDNGPVFYKQKRIGKFGKTFEITKFRTMKIDAEKEGIQFASENDNRATRAGRFLRKTRIDELPQILNVLNGSMSFIGPRPERPEFVSKLVEKKPFYALRHLTKPGLTGWAQINYQYAGTIEENLKKLQYDLFYIKNRSLILDLIITLKTLNTVLRRRGV